MKRKRQQSKSLSHRDRPKACRGKRSTWSQKTEVLVFTLPTGWCWTENPLKADCTVVYVGSMTVERHNTSSESGSSNTEGHGAPDDTSGEIESRIREICALPQLRDYRRGRRGRRGAVYIPVSQAGAVTPVGISVSVSWLSRDRRWNPVYIFCFILYVWVSMYVYKTSEGRIFNNFNSTWWWL